MLGLPDVLFIVIVDMQLIEATGLVAVVRLDVLRGSMELVIAVLGTVIPALADIFFTIRRTAHPQYR